MIGMFLRYNREKYEVLSYPILGEENVFYICCMKLVDGSIEMIKVDHVEVISKDKNHIN